MISMHNGGGEKGEGCTTQRRQVVILQHFAMLIDSDRKGVYSRGPGIGESLVNIIFFM